MSRVLIKWRKEGVMGRSNTAQMQSRESAGIGSTEALFCLEQRVASAAVGKLDDSSVGTGLLCQI